MKRKLIRIGTNVKTWLSLSLLISVFLIIITYNQTTFKLNEQHAMAESSGTTYYVSSSMGNDDWGGTSQNTPWKTLTRVNQGPERSGDPYKPGDKILLKCDDVWTGEALNLNGAGDVSNNNWITLGNYSWNDTGKKPKIMEPPKDHTPGLLDWRMITEYAKIDPNYAPYANRDYIKIAINTGTSRGWKIQGLEISNAEMGIRFSDAINNMFFIIEDCYFNHIEGLGLPRPPHSVYDKSSPCGADWGYCPNHPELWEDIKSKGIEAPNRLSGVAIEVYGDNLTIRNVKIENSSWGIFAICNNSLFENIYIDKCQYGSLGMYLSNNVTYRNVTILNTYYPEFIWGSMSSFILMHNNNVIIDNCEIAYTTGETGDVCAFNLDGGNNNVTIKNCFLHDNAGTAFETGIADNVSPQKNIVIEDNICLRNGRYGILFWYDGVANNDNVSYYIRNNKIYEPDVKNTKLAAFFFFVSEKDNWCTDDIEIAEKNSVGNIYDVINLERHPYGTYTLPLPIPSPPPLLQTNLAHNANVTVSNGSGTAIYANDGDLNTVWNSNEKMPWIKYEWNKNKTIDRIRIFDSPDTENWAANGTLTFSDGSKVDVVGGILNNGAMREIILDEPKNVTWVKFTVNHSEGNNVGLTDFQVYQDDLEQ